MTEKVRHFLDVLKRDWKVQGLRGVKPAAIVTPDFGIKDGSRRCGMKVYVSMEAPPGTAYVLGEVEAREIIDREHLRRSMREAGFA